MNTPLSLLLGFALAAVVAALLTGILGFARGGPWYRRHANTLMNLRIVSQSLAVLLLGAVLLFS
jgi:hypothetical protein